MTPPKMILTVLTGGVLLGALFGQLSHPVMKFAEGPDWRARYAPHFSTSPLQIAETGPQDLSTALWYGPSYYGPLYHEPVFADPPPSLPDIDAVPELEMTRLDAEPALPPEPSPDVGEASLAAAQTAADLTSPPTPSSDPLSESQPLASGATVTAVRLFR